MLDFVVFLSVALISYFLWTRYKQLKLREELGFTGPPAKLISGNFHQVVERIRKDKRGFLLMEEWTQIYGPVFGFYIGPVLNITVANLDMAKEILVKNFNNFVDRQGFQFIGKDTPMAHSLLQLEGQKWKNVRNTVTPTFSTGKLRQMSHIIHRKIDILLENLQEHAQFGETFDIYDDLQGLTLDVIGKCAFAMDVNCQKDFNDPFYENCRKFFNNAGFVNAPLFMTAVTRFRSFTTVGEAEQWLTHGLQKVVDERSKMYHDFKSSDVLQLLLQQNDKNAEKGRPLLSRDQIIGNCYAFLLAGYETTSTALAYTSWLLAKNQDIQRKLQAEIDEFFQEHGENEITPENVLNLPYLDAVFHESLRLLPPVVGFVARTCVKECVINGYRFVPGLVVNFPVWSIHHSEENWPDPEVFKPDRFLGSKNYHSMAWMPFGDGPRNCVGMRFAEIEYKMAMVRVMDKYTIEFGPESEDPLPTIQTGVLMRPTNGVKVKVSCRQ